MFSLTELIAIVLGALTLIVPFIVVYFRYFYKLKKEREGQRSKADERIKRLLIMEMMIDPMKHSFFVKIRFYIDHEAWYLGSEGNGENSEKGLSKAKKHIINDMLRSKLSHWYCGYYKIFSGGGEKFDKNIAKNSS